MFMPGSHMHKPEGIEDDVEGTLDGSMVLEAPAGSVLIAHSAWWYVLVALYMPSVLSQTPYITVHLHMLCYIDENMALVPLRADPLRVTFLLSGCFWVQRLP